MSKMTNYHNAFKAASSLSIDFARSHSFSSSANFLVVSAWAAAECRAKQEPKFGFQFHQMPIRAFFPLFPFLFFHDCRFHHARNSPSFARKRRGRCARAREQFQVFLVFFPRSRPVGVFGGFGKGSMLGRFWED